MSAHYEDEGIAAAVSLVLIIAALLLTLIGCKPTYQRFDWEPFDRGHQPPDEGGPNYAYPACGYGVSLPDSLGDYDYILVCR